MSQDHGIDGAVYLHSDEIQDTAFFFEFFSGINSPQAVLVCALNAGQAVFGCADADTDKDVRQVLF